MEDLFSLNSLISLQGSAAAALLVPNVIGYLVGEKFDPYRKWASLVIAMVLAYVAAIVAGDGAMTWLVAFFNGLLIFASAVGINQLPRGKSKKKKSGTGESKKDDKAEGSKQDELELSPAKIKKFFTSWV